MAQLTQRDIAYLRSLPESEWATFISRMERRDPFALQEIIEAVEGADYTTTEKRHAADFFGVSVETIEHWQTKGMPFIAGGKGQRNEYDLRAMSRWIAQQRTAVAAPDDPTRASDAAYRDEKRRIEELKRRKLEGSLVDPTEYRARMIRAINTIRAEVVEPLGRKFGNDAIEILNDGCNRAQQILEERDESEETA